MRMPCFVIPAVISVSDDKHLRQMFVRDAPTLNAVPQRQQRLKTEKMRRVQED